MLPPKSLNILPFPSINLISSFQSHAMIETLSIKPSINQNIPYKEFEHATTYQNMFHIPMNKNSKFPHHVYQKLNYNITTKNMIQFSLFFQVFFLIVMGRHQHPYVPYWRTFHPRYTRYLFTILIVLSRLYPKMSSKLSVSI